MSESVRRTNQHAVRAKESVYYITGLHDKVSVLTSSLLYKCEREMLVYWIPITCSTIHANASHRDSVSALILNEIKEMLVVQQKNGRFQGSGAWKIPTGVVNEDLFAAAIREVKKDTGVSGDECCFVVLTF
ncbi:hypothetical protein ACFE04_031173 [Oxalis oulophora]